MLQGVDKHENVCIYLHVHTSGSINTEQGRGACFGESTCMYWSTGDEACQYIHGPSGLAFSQAGSKDETPLVCA